MKDQLGDRMKSYYEDRFRYYLPRRTYTIIRIDGKAFHTYTKGLQRPFDEGLISDMDETAAYLCKNIMGAKFAYVQSDEISILLTDFDDISTQSWFDGNIQKMASISASMATARFNQLRTVRAYANINTDPIEHGPTAFYMSGAQVLDIKLAMFDARVFQIPYSEEVINYFIFRQQDATRNSISSVAQSLYSHKELHGKSSDEMQEMIFQKGVNWNDFSYREKRGGVITKVTKDVPVKNPKSDQPSTVTRNKWEPVKTPIFSQEKDFLKSLMPNF
jgi:tRNA(His) 5'-end guanylyltransferase